jgi:hypothetical protein
MENNEADIQTPTEVAAFTKNGTLSHLGEAFHLHYEQAKEYIQEHWSTSRAHRVRYAFAPKFYILC